MTNAMTFTDFVRDIQTDISWPEPEVTSRDGIGFGDFVYS